MTFSGVCGTTSPPQTMHVDLDLDLEVRRAVPEDAPAIVSILTDSPSELMRAMQPGASTAEARRQMLEGVLAEISDLTGKTLVTVASVRQHPMPGSSDGKVVGHAKWRLFLRDEDSVSEEPELTPQGEDHDVAYRFKMGLHRGRLEHTVGRSHVRECAYSEVGSITPSLTLTVTPTPTCTNTSRTTLLHISPFDAPPIHTLACPLQASPTSSPTLTTIAKVSGLLCSGTV